jgi:hypothetical protein
MMGGFDIAVLTHKTGSEALAYKASLLSETAKKERILLLSKRSNTKPTPVVSKIPTNIKPKRTINRKKITFDEAFTYNGKAYRVNTAKSGLYVEILEAMINQFEIAAAKWKRVFVLRFDLHMSIYRKDNQLITAFRKRLFQKLKREYGFKDIGFCWVREQERAKASHYHWVLFLDGDLIRHSNNINEMVKQAWERQEGNYHVPTIKRPYYFVDSEAITQDAIYRVSYLAKPRGKGYRDKQAKDYNCSRMKPP